ncbi:MAG: ATP-binding cassette domain-containing protein [Rhodospirillales bacterium]|nr:ATP-binding cassette domain-containing protein [Rhodospirillales bacterium]
MATAAIRNFFGKKQKVEGDAALGAFAYMPGGIFDLVLASVFINILALALPLTLLQVYDRIIPNDGRETLSLMIIGVGVALALEAILELGRSYVSGWMAARFEHLAGCNAMERLLHTSIIDYERQGAGVHMERMNSLSVLKEFYAGQAVLAMCDLPFAVIYLGAIFYLAGNLVFVPILLIVFFIISAATVGKKLKKSLENRMFADDRRYSFIIEVLSGVHTIKGLAMEEQMLRRYERLQETCAGAERQVALNSASAVGIGAVFSQLTMFSVVGFGSTFVVDGALTVGGLAACTMLAGRSMQPLQKAVGIWTRFQSISLARERLRDLFKLNTEPVGHITDISDMHGELKMQGIWFDFGQSRDGDDLPPVFEDLSLHVPAGATVGIRGGNASGKTSLLHLMNGLLLPVKGTVTVDGVDITEYDPAVLRQEVAYLPQEGVLFNGTLLENLTMFRPQLNETAFDMARLLGLDQVVAHMPFGYDTPVGDGAGDTMPRGIKQRIAIARALVDKPRVLLFDEANTAMDSAGDAMLKDLMMRLQGRVTLVLVTARPSLLELADVVYEISDHALIPWVDPRSLSNGGST